MSLLLILFILLIVAALVVAGIAYWRHVAKVKHNLINGGTESKNPTPGNGVHHHMGHGIHDYAKTLNIDHHLGTHPLNQSDYTALPTSGGAPKKRTLLKPKKQWDSYKSWEDMILDEGAKNEYFRLRATVLSYPNLDWTKVMADMRPKLLENREYIGVASLESDGKTLRILASEASPTVIGETDSDTTIAGVPGHLVAKYANMPGIILFHTHPADIRCSPLPSSHDLSAAIYFGATSRFAACAVISRYGVFAHGLDWSAYKAINEATDWKLASLNFSHDVVATHEAIRSWSSYTMADYLAIYPRLRMLMFTYPTSEMVGDSRRYTWMWDLESNIDHGLISDHSNDIKSHRKNNKNNQKPLAAFATVPEDQISID
jgi:hypothetical protein